MFFNKIKNTMMVVLFFGGCLFFASCPQETEEESSSPVGKTATVSFFNESSFRVDVYKNLNPEHFDPTTLVCTLNLNQTKKIEMYPSADQVIGDAFFPRYKVLLANSYETGTSDIYVDAQRVLSNVTFVIESEKNYTKTIPQPGQGELNFINSYMKIQNMESIPMQIIAGDTILQKMDDKGVYLKTEQIGYFEIEFSVFDNIITMSNINAYNNINIPFPVFTTERGKLYSFTISGGNVTGPVVTTILY
jgi:hypothetical protein